ncbi:MAG: AraC family transcriptional regulator [Hyphomicrobiaceae bacterium]|nr:AraC family transcriptional regulator [Hyphomicrobiaceae bacterium]
MDVLSDIFDTMRFRATGYFRTECSPPWAFALETDARTARFHLVVQGRCHVGLGAGQTVAASAGDLVVVQRGLAHTLADCAGRCATPLAPLIERSGHDGRNVVVLGEGTSHVAAQLVCGRFSFAAGADHPVLRALPSSIVIGAADRLRHPLLDDALRLVGHRAATGGLGACAAMSRLSEVVYLETVRASIERSPDLARIIGAMRDGSIGRALEMLHETPGKPWSVETLAHAAGMSRSRFAERFSALMGQPPMGYLAEWRLQKALYLLAQQRFSVQDIARQVGYRSTAAFSRAFAQEFGIPPSGYKQPSDD